MLDQIQIDRIAFEIPIPVFLQEQFGLGPTFPIFWYGIIIVVGIALGAWWAARELKKRNQPQRVIDEFYNRLCPFIAWRCFCSKNKGSGRYF